MGEDIHFIEDLEERENATPLVVTTLAVGEEGGCGEVTTMSCYETGCTPP